MEIFISIEAVAIALLYFLHFDMDGRVQRSRLRYEALAAFWLQVITATNNRLNAINVEQAVKEETERRMH